MTLHLTSEPWWVASLASDEVAHNRALALAEADLHPKTDSGRLLRKAMMTSQTLSRIQLVLASAGALLAGAGAIWSWYVGDRHEMSLALLILVGGGMSVVMTRVIFRVQRDHPA